MDNSSTSLPIPTKQQHRWQDLELGIFCHFGMNTFCDQEWGEGNDSPSLFNPVKLDARQWVRTAKEAGFRYFVLTAKHHDGFCLWPTSTTDYSITSSPWRDGKGDVVRDCADACREEGIGFGLYLSPWDRHEPCYSDPQAYDNFYANQLEELLTGYGPLVEIWFDGAGSEGREYDWKRIMNLIKQYQPDAMVFNMGAPTICWVGNEDGLAPYPCWNTVESARESMFSEASLKWLTGTPRWVPAECDVPIRKDRWFWHPDEEHLLLPLEQLMDIYYRSVGHGATLLLNLAPDNRGLIPEVDVNRVIAFGDEIHRRFDHSLAEISGEGEVIEIELPESLIIDHIITMEDIAFGERVRDYIIEVHSGGEWMEIIHGSAIGHKKIDRFKPISADKVRLTVLEAFEHPMIRRFALFNCK
ncbi:alpha-L-fucosidase [Paenibacillus anaericanus]|uniref:alpha-L-fucosidase n=1 Tax=Paenibacillus TaxID=44249 RepID=UPI002788D49F|nr:alpha-L-fucosidase [Paenibacillus anaericanus]MDQ0091333.1 alpha-L-fucosidase [Paenibacillus anaericanus]